MKKNNIFIIKNCSDSKGTNLPNQSMSENIRLRKKRQCWCCTDGGCLNKSVNSTHFKVKDIYKTNGTKLYKQNAGPSSKIQLKDVIRPYVDVSKEIVITKKILQKKVTATELRAATLKNLKKNVIRPVLKLKPMPNKSIPIVDLTSEISNPVDSTCPETVPLSPISFKINENINNLSLLKKNQNVKKKIEQDIQQLWDEVMNAPSQNCVASESTPVCTNPEFEPIPVESKEPNSGLIANIRQTPVVNQHNFKPFAPKVNSGPEKSSKKFYLKCVPIRSTFEPFSSPSPVSKPTKLRIVLKKPTISDPATSKTVPDNVRYKIIKCPIVDSTVSVSGEIEPCLKDPSDTPGSSVLKPSKSNQVASKKRVTQKPRIKKAANPLKKAVNPKKPAAYMIDPDAVAYKVVRYPLNDSEPDVGIKLVNYKPPKKTQNMIDKTQVSYMAIKEPLNENLVNDFFFDDSPKKIPDNDQPLNHIPETLVNQTSGVNEQLNGTLNQLSTVQPAINQTSPIIINRTTIYVTFNELLNLLGRGSSDNPSHQSSVDQTPVRNMIEPLNQSPVNDQPEMTVNQTQDSSMIIEEPINEIIECPIQSPVNAVFKNFIIDYPPQEENKAACPVVTSSYNNNNFCYTDEIKRLLNTDDAE